MPRKQPAVAVKTTTPDPPRAGTRITAVTPCTGCGSVACAATGLLLCRHTGAPRDPDPAAAARRAATGLPGPLTTTAPPEAA